MLRLHDSLVSGNGYKCRLLLHHLRLPFERIEVALGTGTGTPAFARLNPEGRIPVLELPDGTTLPESNAILCFLAEGTRWMPAERMARAQVLRWMFWEQYSHEPNIATVRHWVAHLPPDPERERMLPRKRELGRKALGVLEGQLAGRSWLVGEGPTAADLCLYAYTHVAHEGGFDLGPYPALRAWLARVAALPGHVPIEHAAGIPA
ncbi:MAG: glutathione S-transferase family protein [Deltaproteobacteria bacterium]|nr:glutathione S-transferase family protein [Deltaproteobacteria bacterium]